MATYLITGGASGIGKAIVLDATKRQHRVIVIDQHPRPSELPEEVIYYVCDLADQQALARTIEKIKTSAIIMDALIHNAATSKGGVLSASYHDFQEVLSVNVTAPFYLTQQLLPQMSLEASVLFIASTRAFQSQKDGEAYAASKGAVISLMQALSVSLGGRVRVNAITPGWINTSGAGFSKADHQQHPAKRIGTPFDIIEAIYFLADPKQNFIQGTNLIIDGGMSKQMIYHEDEGWRYDPNE